MWKKNRYNEYDMNNSLDKDYDTENLTIETASKIKTKYCGLEMIIGQYTVETDFGEYSKSVSFKHVALQFLYGRAFVWDTKKMNIIMKILEDNDLSIIIPFAIVDGMSSKRDSITNQLLRERKTSGPNNALERALKGAYSSMMITKNFERADPIRKLLDLAWQTGFFNPELIRKYQRKFEENEITARHIAHRL